MSGILFFIFTSCEPLTCVKFEGKMRIISTPIIVHITVTHSVKHNNYLRYVVSIVRHMEIDTVMQQIGVLSWHCVHTYTVQRLEFQMSPSKNAMYHRIGF